MQQAQPSAGTEGAHPFRPNVIRGNFTGVLTGRTTPAADAPAAEMVQLPLYGKIAAGTPIEALRDHSAFADVPTSLLGRSEEHTSELQSLMRISYAVFCLKKKTTQLSNSH